MEDKSPAKSPLRENAQNAQVRELARRAGLSEERGARYAALDLAVQTVRNLSGFSDAQIIRTADRYEKYITDGTIPQPPEPVAADPRGDSDGLV